MNFEVTLQQSVDGKVVATKSCVVTADTEDEAKKCAVECASSCQGGMFNVFLEGKHELTVVSCVEEKPRIIDTGKAARRIDPEEFAKALGAERVPPEEEAKYRRRFPSL